MKGSVYHSIDFLTRVPQTLVTIKRLGHLERWPREGHVTPELILNLLFYSLTGFFVLYTISDFAEA